MVKKVVQRAEGRPVDSRILGLEVEVEYEGPHDSLIRITDGKAGFRFIGLRMSIPNVNLGEMAHGTQ